MPTLIDRTYRQIRALREHRGGIIRALVHAERVFFPCYRSSSHVTIVALAVLVVLVYVSVHRRIGGRGMRRD